DPDALLATGFNRHYADESNARNLVQRRQEILNDVTDTVGSVFVGLTFACARCHDHKFDPILQADYYRLQAFFASAGANDNIPLSTPAAQAAYAKRLARWQEETCEIRQQLSEIEEPHRKAVIKEYVDKYPEEIQQALSRSAEERTPLERMM